MLLVACSRREGVFSLSPVFTTSSTLSAPVLTQCVMQRWKQGARRLHRGKSGKTLTLRAESFFSGSAIGLKVMPDGRRSRVEYFERRSTAPLYWSMVRDCLHPDASHTPNAKKATEAASGPTT